MNYTLHQLRVFCKVCDYQSVTRAAEALHLTQPAVSLQLKKFQESFEIPLVEVVNRQLYVTTFGRQIESLAREMLDKAQEIESAADAHRGLLTGDIKIASASTGKYVLPYFLTGFIRQHPGVNISVDVTNKTLVVDALRTNAVDFAVVSVIPDQLRLHPLPLLPNELYLVAAVDYPGLPARMTPKKLAGFPLLLREPGSATRQAMEQFLRTAQVSGYRSMQLVSNEAVKQAVRAGLGLSILPRIGIRTELAAGDLQIVPMRGLPIVTEWNLVFNQGKQLSPAARALLAHIGAEKQRIVAASFTPAPGRP